MSVYDWTVSREDRDNILVALKERVGVFRKMSYQHRQSMEDVLMLRKYADDIDSLRQRLEGCVQRLEVEDPST